MKKLPFKAGQEAEAKSFIDGYRGAWFRCKIRAITKRKGILGHISEYYDYPEEKVEWDKLYQIPPFILNAKEKRRELVLRPRYPPIYNEKEMPNASEVSEVTVIVCGSWMVGDLVDWWNTGCFWSGRITELINDHEALIELKLPPLGEGSSYRVLLKDLRPYLDWSHEHGWSIPTQEGGCGLPYARLIEPINEDFSSGVRTKRTTLFNDDAENCEIHNYGDNNTRKTSPSRKSVSKQSIDVENDLNFKRCGPSKRCAQYSQHTRTLEATILDLEEYISKVKWLKRILEYGITSCENGQWMFVEPSPQKPHCSNP